MSAKRRSSLAARALQSLPPARKAAYLALEQLHSQTANGPALQNILDKVLRNSRLKPEDAALASNLVYGTERFAVRLDWLLNRYLKRPGDLPPALRDILRLAAYEIVFLDAVPAYASANWAVEATKNAFGPRLGGLVNAVLRRVVELEDLPRQRSYFETEIAATPDQLAVWHSQPRWLIDHFLDAYPQQDASAYLEAFIAEPVTGLRLNQLKAGWETLRDNLAQQPGCLAAKEFSLAFSAAHKPADLEELIRQGYVSRQSYSAQLILQELLTATINIDADFMNTLQQGVWDACAGRGNKTCALLETGIPVRLASDINRARLRGLAEDMQRLGLQNSELQITVADATEPCPITPCPPVILADAPCSGLGTLNHRPDIKYRRKPADLADLAALQARILDTLFTCLPPGGYLLYLTCTLNPAENENLLESFSAAHPSAQLLVSVQTPPDAPDHEFFFAAALKKPKHSYPAETAAPR